jgi:hypothetical protein
MSLEAAMNDEAQRLEEEDDPELKRLMDERRAQDQKEKDEEQRNGELKRIAMQAGVYKLIREIAANKEREADEKARAEEDEAKVRKDRRDLLKRQPDAGTDAQLKRMRGDDWDRERWRD